MNKYITQEMIDKFNKQLEEFGTCVRYEFFKDPDGFPICDRGVFTTNDMFLSDKSFIYVTDEFREFVQEYFKDEYNIKVRVCEITGNIWVGDED